MIEDLYYGSGAAGVLVLHGGAGITDHERAWAADLAARGFRVSVPDLFGERFRDRAHGMAVIQALVADPRELRSRLGAACDRLATRSIGALGFCFGGLAALELARADRDDVRCAIAIHGGLHTVAPGPIRADVLVCTGAADPFVTAAHRAAFEAEMTAAGARWQLHLYGGAEHGFTEEATGRPGCGYHPAAARAARAAAYAQLDASLA